MGVLFRFLIVGMLNSGVGYAFILLGLWLGFGDYLANAMGYAIGLGISYALHRNWTFAVSTAVSWREVARFAVAVIVAYSVNLTVIHLARSLGYFNSSIVQGVAMATYSCAFFILTRFLVFRSRNAATEQA
jgi:putative flippase GtrA